MRHFLRKIYERRTNPDPIIELDLMFPQPSYAANIDIIPAVEALVSVASQRAQSSPAVLKALLKLAYSAPEFIIVEEFMLSAQIIAGLAPIKNEPKIIKALAAILTRPSRYSDHTLKMAMVSLIDRREEPMAKALLQALVDSKNNLIKIRARDAVRTYDIKAEVMDQCEVLLNRNILNAKDFLNFRETLDRKIKQRFGL